MRGFKMDRSFYVGDYQPVDPSLYGGPVDGFEAYSKVVDGKYYAKVFFGKQAKPIWHFSFGTNEARMLAKMKGSAASRKASLDYKAEKKQAKKEFQHTVKVGDVFGTSWGYEQTNREFFQVIEVKGKSVIIRELAQEGGRRGADGFGPFAGKTHYVRDSFIGGPVRKLILNGNDIKFESFRWGSLVTDVANDNGFYVSWGY